MIVMKFGRSSVASATTIEWVARIVKSRLEDQPALVVSAMGKTTDRPEEMMQHAARGSAYSVWCLFDELAASTFQEVKRLLLAGATGGLGETNCAEVPRVARLADLSGTGPHPHSGSEGPDLELWRTAFQRNRGGRLRANTK